MSDSKILIIGEPPLFGEVCGYLRERGVEMDLRPAAPAGPLLYDAAATVAIAVVAGSLAKTLISALVQFHKDRLEHASQKCIRIAADGKAVELKAFSERELDELRTLLLGKDGR